jgi:hypothetical protein
MAGVAHAAGFHSNSVNGIIAGFPRAFLEPVTSKEGLLFFSPTREKKSKDTNQVGLGLFGTKNKNTTDQWIFGLKLSVKPF